MESGKLRLTLLGPPEACRDDARLSFRTKKSLALLCYLATEGGIHQREKLAALLWPESSGKRARTTLRRALAYLRSALGSGVGTDDEYLLVDRDSLGLGAEERIDLDLTPLRTAYELARHSTGIDRPDGEERQELILRLREGSEAYHGEFLQDFHLYDAPEFDDWANQEREGWRVRLVVVLNRLSELLLEGGEVREAVDVAERWVAHEPSDQVAHELLMRARHALGDSAGALRVYEEYRSAAEDKPEVVTSPQMEALAARISAERREEVRPPGYPNDRTLGRGTVSLRPAPTEAPLFGRAEEISVLAGEYVLASLGTTRTVAVVGEAGIGKTRLVEEFLRWSTAEGADVLRGNNTGAGEGIPYGSVISAIRQRLERERAPDDLLEDVWLSELGRLLPELRERYPDLTPPTYDETTAKSRLFEAVVRLFDALARSSPVTVFVDDLQWADAATLELLRYVIHRLAEDNAPVLLVVAIREEEIDRVVDLRGWLSTLERGAPLKHLALGNLSDKDTLRMLRSLAGDIYEEQEPGRNLKEFGRRLHAETSGQPFFLLETIRALLDKGVLAAEPLVTDHITAVTYAEAISALENLLPPGVRGLVRERLAHLNPASSDLLVAGAVLGDGFDFELLRRVADLGEREGLLALDKTLNGRLLRESDFRLRRGRDEYSFVHDKIRDVVYTDAGEARRRVFHRRALKTLQENGAPSAELARHALSAAMSEEASRHSLDAAEEALAVFAVGDARAHFDRAKSLLGGESSGIEGSRISGTEGRFRLYAGLGRVHELTREWGEAQNAYERMLAGARESGDREVEWRALHRLATLGVKAGVAQTEREGEFHRGVRREGIEEGDGRGVWSPGDATPDDFVWSLSTARDCATEALLLARQMHREDLVAQSLTALGVLEAYTGRWERVLSISREGLSMYGGMSDRATENEFMRFYTYTLVMTGEPGEAIRRMRDHLGLTGKLSEREISRTDIYGMSFALLETGDYEEALRVARRGLAAARSVAYAPRLMFNLVALGDVLRTLFRVREAGEIYSEMGSVVFPPEYRALVHSKLCAVAVLEADWEEAHAEAVLAARTRDDATVQITEALHRHLEVEALLRSGERALAREQLERFDKAVGENRRLRLAYLRALAVLRQWEGDGAMAIEHLREARGLAEEFSLPGELWQLETSLAELHEEMGNRAEASRSYSKAAVIVRRLADRIVDRELRQRFLSASQVRYVLGKS